MDKTKIINRIVKEVLSEAPGDDLPKVDKSVLPESTSISFWQLIKKRNRSTKKDELNSWLI